MEATGTDRRGPARAIVELGCDSRGAVSQWIGAKRIAGEDLGSKGNGGESTGPRDSRTRVQFPRRGQSMDRTEDQGMGP